MLERKDQIAISDTGRVAQTGYRILRDENMLIPMRLRGTTLDSLYIAIKRWKDDCLLGRLSTAQVQLCVVPFGIQRDMGEKESLEMFFEHNQGRAVDISINSYWYNNELVTQSSEKYNPGYLNIFGRVLESLEYAKMCRVVYRENVIHMAVMEEFI